MSNQISPPPVTVPYELIFDLPSSMLDSRKIEQRIQPYSQSTFNSAGQVPKFTIPQTDRTLASGQTMYLTGQVDLASLGTIGTDTYAVLGSYYSIFSRQVVSANGTVWETIERPGELVNMLINMTMNSAEKLSQVNGLGASLGSKTDTDYIIDATTNLAGPIINVSAAAGNINVGNANNKSFTFAIPIIGVLDANKYIPMWNSNIDLEMSVNAINNWLVSIAGTYGNPTFTLSNLELVFDSIELSPESFNMVMSNYPQKVVIKTQSYLAGSSLGFIGSGAQDIPINARLSSMKQLFFYFNQTGLADQTFGGINPNGNDVVFITNGKYFPQRPIKLNNPSELYMQIQKSFGSIKSYSHSGSIGKTELCVRQTANGLFNAPLVATNKANLVYYGNKCYLAIDTEIINTNKASLYNGIQTGVNSNIRLNIANELTTNVNCLYWCCYDVLLEMDFTTGISRAIY